MSDILVHVFFDRDAVVSAQRGAYRAHNIHALRMGDGGNCGRRALHSAGRTREEALESLRRTADSFGLTQKLRVVKALDGDMLAHAVTIAARVHAGQVDLGGAPYIHHPASVALRLPTPDLQEIGWLHDVPEDSEKNGRKMTLDDLAEEGFSDMTLVPLQALTKRKGEHYETFVQRIIACGPRAIAVKIADVRENMRADRAVPHDGREERLRKYAAALVELTDALQARDPHLLREIK